ncbi:hypothetical protein LTR94_028417, partial [Friedmanniomyces endolithicus]
RDDRAGTGVARQLGIDDGGRLSAGLIVEEDFRVQRRRRTHQARHHLDLAQARLPAAIVDDAPLGRDQIGQGRAADVDDHVPLGPAHLLPKIDPVSGGLLLVEDDDALDVRRRAEEGGRRTAAGDRNLHARQLTRDLADHARGDDAVADPVGADEEGFGCGQAGALAACEETRSLLKPFREE